MMRLIERRPDKLGHAGIDNKKLLSRMIFLFIENLGQKHR